VNSSSNYYQPTGDGSNDSSGQAEHQDVKRADRKPGAKVWQQFARHNGFQLLLEGEGSTFTIDEAVVEHQLNRTANLFLFRGAAKQSNKLSMPSNKKV